MKRNMRDYLEIISKGMLKEDGYDFMQGILVPGMDRLLTDLIDAASKCEEACDAAIEGRIFQAPPDQGKHLAQLTQTLRNHCTELLLEISNLEATHDDPGHMERIGRWRRGQQ